MNSTTVAGFGKRVYDTTGNRCFSGSGDRTINDHCFFAHFISKIYFFEEGIRSGGVGEKLASLLMQCGYKGEFALTSIEDKFVEQAKINELLDAYKLSKNEIIKFQFVTAYQIFDNNINQNTVKIRL